MNNHIIRLTSENVKRLKAVEITPSGNIVVIGGDNGQGKTSVLDSIMMALGGASTIPVKPVRDGEKKAKIVVELDNGLVVTRKFTAAGGTELTVTGADGNKFSSPQSMLDALVGRLSFDPLEFMRQDARKQSETLRTLVGLDFTELDQQRERLYVERTVVGRNQRSAENRLAGRRPTTEALPAEEVSAQVIMDEQSAAAAKNSANAKSRQAASDLKLKAEFARSKEQQQKQAVDRLAEEIAEMQKRLAAGNDAWEKLKLEADQKESEANAATTEADALKDIDMRQFHNRLDEIETTNRKIREQREIRAAKEEVETHTRKAENLTSQIEEIDQKKRAALSSAAYPIDGLKITPEGAVEFNGIPISQVSGAEQLRVSVAIGLALNPKLKVLLIRDGSLLDEKSLAMVSEMATAAEAQVWIEMVSKDKGKCSVIIQDGEVIGGAE